MSFYFPNVDKTFIFQRKGTSDDPYIFRHETHQVINSTVTLLEIPDSVNKVIVKKTDGTSLSEVTTDTLQTNQYRVDYSTGIVYFDSSLENNNVTCDFYGMGMISFPSSRVWVDTNNGSSIKTLQQLVTDMDNVKTNWLTAVNAFADIATTYLTPQLGDTVQTISDNKIFRFDGSSWINTQQYSASALTDLQNKYSNLTSSPKTKTWSATAGQLTYTFDTDSYTVGQGKLTVYVGGVIQIPVLNFTETSSTSFTLTCDSSEIVAGLNVVAIYR